MLVVNVRGDAGRKFFIPAGELRRRGFLMSDRGTGKKTLTVFADRHHWTRQFLRRRDELIRSCDPRRSAPTAATSAPTLVARVVPRAGCGIEGGERPAPHESEHESERPARAGRPSSCSDAHVSRAAS